MSKLATTFLNEIESAQQHLGEVGSMSSEVKPMIRWSAYGRERFECASICSAQVEPEITLRRPLLSPGVAGDPNKEKWVSALRRPQENADHRRSRSYGRFERVSAAWYSSGGMAWLTYRDSSKIPSMLSFLVNEFDTVTVRIQNVSRIIAWAVVEPDGGCAVVGGSCRNRRLVGGFDLLPVVCDKANVHSMAIRRSLT